MSHMKGERCEEIKNITERYTTSLLIWLVMNKRVTGCTTLVIHIFSSSGKSRLLISEDTCNESQSKIIMNFTFHDSFNRHLLNSQYVPKTVLGTQLNR